MILLFLKKKVWANNIVLCFEKRFVCVCVCVCVIYLVTANVRFVGLFLYNIYIPFPLLSMA